MKKFLATILALVMVLSLVACGGDGGTTESKEAAENPRRREGRRGRGV